MIQDGKELLWHWTWELQSAIYILESNIGPVSGRVETLNFCSRCRKQSDVSISKEFIVLHNWSQLGKLFLISLTAVHVILKSIHYFKFCSDLVHNSSFTSDFVPS